MLIFSIIWLLIVGLVALFVLAIPTFPAPTPGQALIIVVVTFFVMFTQRLWRGASRASWLIVLAGLLILPFGVVARAFGGIDMLAFLFHYQFGTQGATLAGLENEITAAVLSVVIFIVASIGLSKLLNQPRAIAWVAAAVLLSVNPGLRYGIQRLIEGPYDSGLTALLHDPTPPRTEPENPDVLIVYLEGFERRYTDPDLFEDAANKIDPVLKRAINFHDIRQVEGTGWSVAGVVASQCGVPPLPNGLVIGHGFADQAEFLSERYCLSDALSDRGYRNEFVVGAELEFGGLRNFLESHSYAQITGINEMRSAYSAEEFAAANVDWNVDDQMVYDRALHRHRRLLESEQPFLLVVETFSLHGRVSVVSRSCNAGGKAEASTDIAQAASCAVDDFLTFLEAYKAQQGHRPVRIILMSDHLSHYDGIDIGLPQTNRRNLVSFLTDADGARIVDKPASMIDVYPTILDWLGLISEPERAGLGVSLLSDLPTLVEEHGEDRVNEAFLKDAGLASAIWAN